MSAGFIMHTRRHRRYVELTAVYHEHPIKSNDARAESMANLKCYLMYGFVEYGLDDGTPFVSVDEQSRVDHNSRVCTPITSYEVVR